MSFELIGLGKFLRVISAAEGPLVSIIRDDIRRDIANEEGSALSSGGDFYGPFWADAKSYLAGRIDLERATAERIASNEVSRGRLYPLLLSGFMQWWSERRRLRNEPFEVIQESRRGRHNQRGLGIIKVENTLSIRVGDDGSRIVYPYFCEDPLLSEEAARIGLWIIGQCISGINVQDIRIVDVFRGASFATYNCELRGDEESLFIAHYERILNRWREIRDQY